MGAMIEITFWLSIIILALFIFTWFQTNHFELSQSVGLKEIRLAVRILTGAGMVMTIAILAMSIRLNSLSPILVEKEEFSNYTSYLFKDSGITINVLVGKGGELYRFKIDGVEKNKIGELSKISQTSKEEKTISTKKE